MNNGRQRTARAIVWAQACLVWGLKEVDPKEWIEKGEIGEKPDKDAPLELTEEQKEDVAAYMQRIQEAGKFVMPEA